MRRFGECLTSWPWVWRVVGVYLLAAAGAYWHASVEQNHEPVWDGLMALGHAWLGVRSFILAHDVKRWRREE